MSFSAKSAIYRSLGGLHLNAIAKSNMVVSRTTFVQYVHGVFAVNDTYDDIFVVITRALCTLM